MNTSDYVASEDSIQKILDKIGDKLSVLEKDWEIYNSILLRDKLANGKIRITASEWSLGFKYI